MSVATTYLSVSTDLERDLDCDLLSLDLDLEHLRFPLPSLDAEHDLDFERDILLSLDRDLLFRSLDLDLDFLSSLNLLVDCFT